MAYATHENSVTLSIGDDVFTCTDHLGRMERAKRKVSERALMLTKYTFAIVPQVCTKPSLLMMVSNGAFTYNENSARFFTLKYRPVIQLVIV